MKERVEILEVRSGKGERKAADAKKIFCQLAGSLKKWQIRHVLHERPLFVFLIGKSKETRKACADQKENGDGHLARC